MKRKYLDLVWLRGIGALKADAQNSYLGSLWWILEPLLLTALFYLAFSSGIRGGSNGIDFVIFLMCGMLPFKWTASCLGAASNSLISNKGILGQVYLPKWIFPASINLSQSIRFIFVLFILIAFVIYSGYEPNSNWTSLGYIILCHLIFNLGLSYTFAAATPIVPDLAHVVPLVITGLMFTSGIFFDIADKPAEIQAILRLNPFVEILDSYRTVLIKGEAVQPMQLIYPWLVGIGAYTLGITLLSTFNRYYPRAL
jgi:lipopolysaccharide transport system permease protein